VPVGIVRADQSVKQVEARHDGKRHEDFPRREDITPLDLDRRSC
jgi:hypothetical protein